MLGWIGVGLPPREEVTPDLQEEEKGNQTFLTRHWPGPSALLPSRCTFIKLRLSALSLLVLFPHPRPTPHHPSLSDHFNGGHFNLEDPFFIHLSAGGQSLRQVRQVSKKEAAGEGGQGQP